MPDQPFVTDVAGPLRYAVVPTPLGELTLVADDVALVAVHYPGATVPDDGAWGEMVDPTGHPVLREAAAQLVAYLSGSARRSSCPCARRAPTSSARRGRPCSRSPTDGPAPTVIRPNASAGRPPSGPSAPRTAATRFRSSSPVTASSARAGP